MRSALFRRAALAAGLAFMAWSGAAQAAESINVSLSGAQQVPPVETKGEGTAAITYDPSTRMVTWDITFSGLSSPVTMAHFHDATTGKNGPVTLWLSKKGEPAASPIKGEATLTAAQAAQFAAGDWYINVHTKDHPAGEIRGQVTPPKM
jgi:hypothetical protein